MNYIRVDYRVMEQAVKNQIKLFNLTPIEGKDELDEVLAQPRVSIFLYTFLLFSIDEPSLFEKSSLRDSFFARHLRAFAGTLGSSDRFF